MGSTEALSDLQQSAGRVPRVLFLASFFPRPLNMLLGPWALAQAQALRRRIPDLQVVSLTPWVPTAVARSPGAAAYARCPREHQFGDLPVFYPRWILYPIQPLKRWAYTDPWRQLHWGWISAARSVRRIVQQTRPDVIFAHHTAANGYVARQLQREFGLPYVVTDHDFDEVRDCGRFPRRRELFAEVYENASAVVAVAKRMENDMRRLFPGARAHTVRNGVDAIPGDLQLKPRPAELSGRKIVFSAGMFYQRKGFPLLIDAFSRVAGRHPTAILRIGGDGPDRALVEEAARKANLGDRVQLLGKLPHDAVLQEMVWSDLFALVGWDEPFATVFIEAMSAGKPLLCANDGGINDVVIDGVHGRTVPPKDVQAAADALDQLLSNDAGRAVMGAAAAKLVADRLTWNANANTMLELFAEAAGSRGGRRSIPS